MAHAAERAAVQFEVTLKRGARGSARPTNQLPACPFFSLHTVPSLHSSSLPPALLCLYLMEVLLQEPFQVQTAVPRFRLS